MWLLLTLFVTAIAAKEPPPPLQEVFAWKEVSFAWPDDQTRDEAINKGEYIPSNNLPLGIEIWKDKLFVTIPRWKTGVAATLNYVPLKPTVRNATLIPYPDWKANQLPNGKEKPEDNHIASTFRVKVDSCDRLWVIDTGLDEIFGGNQKAVSPPALIVFDLKTDKLLRRYKLKPSDLKEGFFFANIAVDVTPDKCDEAFAYLPDVGAFGMVVYSWKDNDSWRVTHNFFHTDPLKGDFNVGGVNFQWPDGVFGIALGPINEEGYRTVYFHPLSSTKEFSVSNQVLKDRSLALDPKSYHSFKYEGERGENTQSSTSVFDEKSNVIFFTQLQKDGFACWNPRKPLNPKNLALLATDKENLVFTNEVRIDAERNLWVFADHMPVFLYKGLELDKENFKIYKAKIDDLIKDTECDA